MTDAVLPLSTSTPLAATRTLDWAVRAWFVLAVLGHALFFIYIVAVFFPPVAQSGLEGLKGLHLPAGFRPGDSLGNLAAVAHVLLAAVVIGGGPVQLIPAIRNKAPKFHRWLGRSYLVAAVVSALGGLYMTWTRHSIGNLWSQITISIDGILILAFAALALRSVMLGQLAAHRRWALRLFMAASAVWFFRIALMGWLVLTGGMGIDFQSFTGPFLAVLGLAQYLLPLAMLQWYFYCQQARVTRAQQWAFIGTLLPLTGFMLLGIAVATLKMWWPRI